MKKIILFVISCLFIIGCSVSASETVTYNIEEIGVMIAFPKEYQVYDENHDNVYITAFADNETLIEVEYDNNSAIANGLLNLENLSYSKTEILIKHIKEDAEEMGLEIKDYNHYVFNRLPFVQVLYHNPETSEKCIQYATIFDSALYSVTLKSYGDEISPKYEKSLLHTMESFYIYKTERIADTSEYWKNKNYVEYSLDEIGIDISIPSDHIVITKDNLPQFCEQYNVPIDEATKEFEDDDIYLWITDPDLTYKICITAAPVNEGPSFTSDMLNKEEKQNLIERIRKEYSENWASPSDICIFNLSDLTFINVIVPDFLLVQNGTLYNSKGLTLTMMVTDGELTDTHKTLLNDITRTIKFHTPPETLKNNIKSQPVPMTIVTTLAPITILILIIAGLVLIIKKREKNSKNSGKNPIRLNFENTCTNYEKSTIFLKIYVIYLLPLQMILNALSIISLITNEQGLSLAAIVLCVLCQLILVFCIYHVRKNAMLLNKKGYIFLIAYFTASQLITALGEDIAATIPNIVIILLFYIYMNKRNSLFLN